MSETLVKVENISKKFCRNLKRSLWYGMKDLGNEIIGLSHNDRQLRRDEFWAVKDVSFELKRGECLGLIGRNGAGKTTLLRMLNGLLRPDKGLIEMRGRVGALIALGAGFNPILTGRENIYVNASVLGLSREEIDVKFDEIVDFTELSEFIDMPVQSYSSGMQVRLGFAVATALEPDILLLDEVLAVGDAAFRVKCFNRIQEIIKRSAVIFVSHNMSQVTRICNQLLLLHDGHNLTQGIDVGSVITRYHSLIDTSMSSSVEGSGKAHIKSVTVQDAQKTPCSSLIYGEPFSIDIYCNLSHEVVVSIPMLLITISDQEDQNVAQVYEPLAAIPDIKNLRVSLDFSAAVFNAGRYWLTVSILFGEKGELACVFRRASSFIVEHGYVGYAPIILMPSVKISYHL